MIKSIPSAMTSWLDSCWRKYRELDAPFPVPALSPEAEQCSWNSLLLARLLRWEAQAIFSLNLGQRIYKKEGRNWSPNDPVGRVFSSKCEDLRLDLQNLSEGGWTGGRAAPVSHPGTPVGGSKAETGGSLEIMVLLACVLQQ